MMPCGRMKFCADAQSEVKCAENTNISFTVRRTASLAKQLHALKGALSEKRQIPKGICRFWQGHKDSNPEQRFWRPTCYHYTIPLCCVNNRFIIAQAKRNVNHFFREKKFFFVELFCAKVIDKGRKLRYNF